MFQEGHLQDRIQQSERKIRELTINLEKLDREYQQLLWDIGLTPEQIQTYVSDESNFSQSIWENLQNQKKKLDEKLTLVAESVKDPTKLKKKFSERGSIQRHWIFVR